MEVILPMEVTRTMRYAHMIRLPPEMGEYILTYIQEPDRTWTYSFRIGNKWLFNLACNISRKNKTPIEWTKKRLDDVLKYEDAVICMISEGLLHFDFRLADYQLKALSNKCSNLKEFNLNDWDNIKTTKCFSKFKELESVVISPSDKLRNLWVRDLVRGCPQLKRLTLTKCSVIADTALKKIGENLSDLEELKLDGCDKITDEGISSLVSKCTKLRILNLYFCELLTDTSLIKLGQHCPDLEHLNVNHCEHLSDVGLIVLVKGCSQLRILKLSCCVNITDDGVKNIGQHSKYLEYLDLTQCYKISNEGLYHLSQGCKSLKFLLLVGCNLTNKSIRPYFSTTCVIHMN